MATDYSHRQRHAHFLPPPLGSVAVKKFMLGCEILSEPQYNLIPKRPAVRLRNVSDAHYLGSECDQ
ncbi:MAG: hypothetical protein ABGW75_04220 [Pirellulales bacterium]